MPSCRICRAQVPDDQREEHRRVCHAPAQDEYARAEREAIVEIELDEERRWREEEA